MSAHQHSRITTTPSGARAAAPGRWTTTMVPTRRALFALRVALLFALGSIAGVPDPAGGVEVGDPAPGFTLPATTGGDISLSAFKGKKYVLLEFYGADFAPA